MLQMYRQQKQGIVRSEEASPLQSNSKKKAPTKLVGASDRLNVWLMKTDQRLTMRSTWLEPFALTRTMYTPLDSPLISN